jgi:hypothetical protein
MKAGYRGRIAERNYARMTRWMVSLAAAPFALSAASDGQGRAVWMKTARWGVIAAIRTPPYTILPGIAGRNFARQADPQVVQ